MFSFMVVGTNGSGKSTFLETLTRLVPDMEEFMPFVSTDVLHDTFFGVEVHTRDPFLLSKVSGSFSGYILLFDTTRPETFDETYRLLSVLSLDLPGVVVAYKADVAGAVLPEDLRRMLFIPPSISILSCSCMDPESIRKVMYGFFNMVVGQ